MPFTVLWHLEGRAAFLFENVNGVVLPREGSGEVLRTVVIDEIHRGRLLILDLGRSDDPAEGIILFAEIARQGAIVMTAPALFLKDLFTSPSPRWP